MVIRLYFYQSSAKYPFYAVFASITCGMFAKTVFRVIREADMETRSYDIRVVKIIDVVGFQIVVDVKADVRFRFHVIRIVVVLIRGTGHRA